MASTAKGSAQKAQPTISGLDIGSRIVSRRKALGWTQRELARRAALSPHRLSKLERGRAVLTLAEAADLARTLGVLLDDLVLGAREGETPPHPALLASLEEFSRTASSGEVAVVVRLIRFLVTERQREGGGQE